MAGLFTSDSNDVLSRVRQERQQYNQALGDRYGKYGGLVTSTAGLINQNADLMATGGRAVEGAADPRVQQMNDIKNIFAQVGTQVGNTSSPEFYKALAQALGQKGYADQAQKANEKANEVEKSGMEMDILKQKKVEGEQQALMRKELLQLGPKATEQDILNVVSKYASADKLLSTMQSSLDRQASSDARVEAARVAAEAKIEAAREAGASREAIAQMQIEGRKQIAELVASLKGEKPLTEFQGKSLTFGTRAADANNILSSLEGDYSKIAANYLPSFLNSAQGQKVQQAQQNFVNAVLRQESGAAINKSEFENAAKQYFPQPGDTQEVLAQKKKNRDMVVKGFAKQAGPGEKDVMEIFNNPPKKVDKTSFNSVEEANKANLPKGTIITINGRKAIVE